MSKRISYFDSLRGIAIILVIIIHTYTASNFQDYQSIFNIIVREFCNLAVPLFLFISGFFVGQKPFKDRSNYLMFLKKQLPRVYIPCLIWSLPIFIYWVFTGKPLVSSLCRVVICSAYGPYYFIALIIQMYILTPFFYD